MRIEGSERQKAHELLFPASCDSRFPGFCSPEAAGISITRVTGRVPFRLLPDHDDDDDGCDDDDDERG